MNYFYNYLNLFIISVTLLLYLIEHPLHSTCRDYRQSLLHIHETLVNVNDGEYLHILTLVKYINLEGTENR